VSGFEKNAGFSLMEVMIGMFLSTLLMSGIVQLLSGSVSIYRLQLSQGQLEESGRYAREVLVSHITQAGYQPEPWQDLPELVAITTESVDGDDLPGDQLGLQRWSMKNCYGNENPVTDGEGKARFYLLQARFLVNSKHNLTITCRYGPDAANLQTQINNYGLVEDVESMQVLYAEDRDDNRVADSWVTGQAWQSESNIQSIKIALQLATADGHLRKVSFLTSAIRGRLQ